MTELAQIEQEGPGPGPTETREGPGNSGVISYIYRQLAEARPGAFLPAYATSPSNQSIILGALGRRAKALAAGEQAVTIYGARPSKPSLGATG